MDHNLLETVVYMGSDFYVFPLRDPLKIWNGISSWVFHLKQEVITFL